MNQATRFVCSGLISLAITTALFFGMFSLLKVSKATISMNELDLTITHVKPDAELRIRKRQVRKPPELKKSTVQPAAPKLEVTHDTPIQMELPSDLANGKNINLLNQTQIPGFDMDVGQVKPDVQGGVKAGIPPIYPPKAILNNLEGWVLVSITVNAMGLVENVSVIDSEPPRIFDEAAIKSVRKWTFYQKNENGHPIPYQFKQKIEFKIDQTFESD